MNLQKRIVLPTRHRAALRPSVLDAGSSPAPCLYLQKTFLADHQNNPPSSARRIPRPLADVREHAHYKTTTLAIKAG